MNATATTEPVETEVEDAPPLHIQQNESSLDIADDLLTDEERAAYSDGDDVEDTYDDEAVEDEPAAQAPAVEEVPAVQAEGIEAVNFSAKLTEIKAQAEKAREDWENGDLSDADFQKQIAAAAKAEAIVEMKIQEDDRAWNSSVAAFKAANPGIFGDERTLTAFNDIVGDVTESPRYAHLTYAQQLAIAHARLAAEAPVLGLKVAAPAAAAPKAGPAPKPADPAPRPQRPTPPPTLARLPASDAVTESDGRFAQIDRMQRESGNVLVNEAILMRMSPEELEAYGAGADLI